MKKRPKPRNGAAAQVQTPEYRQRVERDKTKYKRKVKHDKSTHNRDD